MDAGLAGSLFRGGGPKPVPRVLPLFEGGWESGALKIAYALPIATATKWVPWPDLTRIKTLRLPSL